MRTGVSDPWAVLGVPRGTDEAGIRAAYRRLAKIRHPDLGGTAGAMAQLAWAYQAVADPARRAAWEADAGSIGRRPTCGSAKESEPGRRPGRSNSQADERPAASAGRRAAALGRPMGSRWGQWAVSLAAITGLALLGHVGGSTTVAITANVLVLISLAQRRPPSTPFWPALDTLTALAVVLHWTSRRW